MQYELKDATWVGSPVPKQGDSTKVEVYVNVITGIVGQAYAGFTNQDTTKMEFSMSMTGTQMQADTQTQAAAFSAAKYPNT